MKKKVAKRTRRPRASAWQKQVEAYLDREEELAIGEGSDLVLQYLGTCRIALTTCQLLGIRLQRPGNMSAQQMP
jgi:hypothetical protein